MSVTSLNQNRHLYVAKTYAANVDETSAVGTIGKVKKTADNELYFVYRGADTVLKSDRIQLKNLDYVKAVDAKDMVTPLKSVEVTLDTAVNGGAPISGQDYVLRIAFRQFYGMSDEDQYFKDVAVHATAAMESNPDLFMQAMVNELNSAFSRELGATKTSNPYLTFTVESAQAADDTTNPPTAASPAKLVITEKPQEWTLGIQSQERVYFEVYPTTVYSGGDDVIWGVVTDVTPAKADAVVGTNAIGNGTKIADLEYFLMGERGDQYRMQGWPNYIPTTYLADATKQYHVLEIHHAFTDTGVNSYRSEKDITIVSDNKAVINSLIGAINSAAGLNIATLA
jgi:hypothetical protein